MAVTTNSFVWPSFDYGYNTWSGVTWGANTKDSTFDAVDKELAKDESNAREYSVTSFWPKDRKRWLDEYDRVKQMRANLAKLRDENTKLREELAEARKPKAGVTLNAATVTRVAKKRRTRR